VTADARGRSTSWSCGRRRLATRWAVQPLRFRPSSIFAVANANPSYVNTHINTSLHIVYSGEVNFTDTPSSVSGDLSRLQGANDGYMDEVNSLRNTCRTVATRVQQFSNPGVFYADRPTGTSTQNNAEALNRTGGTVASFRASVAPVTATP
jgi:hypothetical protein